MKNLITAHITGTFPLRVLPKEEHGEYSIIYSVSWGETEIWIYGDSESLSFSDAEEAAREYLDKNGCSDMGECDETLVIRYAK